MVISEDLIGQEEYPINPLWGSGSVVEVPTDRYTSREYAQAENARLWTTVWQKVCRLEEIPSVGDYLEYTIGDLSILVVRASTDVVKAYINSCLHRGTELKQGCGNSVDITCPFHSWCWNLDGSLDHITSPEDFPGLRPEELSLPECRVEQWGGFVFINPATDPEPFSEFIEPIDEFLKPYRIAEMRVVKSYRMIVRANWKLALEGFEEAYHLMGVHPQGLPGIDDVSTRYDLFGPHSRMIVPVGTPSKRLIGATEEDAIMDFASKVEFFDFIGEDHREALGGLFENIKENGIPGGVGIKEYFTGLIMSLMGDKFPGLSGDQMFNVWQFTVFPNLLINCIPGQFFTFYAKPNGDDPDSCIFEMVSHQLIPDGKEPPPVAAEFVKDPVTYEWPGLEFAQDMIILPQIQAGLRSRPFLRLAGYQEKRLANRLEVIEKYLSADPI